MATIAVDFDGTIVEHRYPEIGNELPFATETLRMLIKDHHRLILWSVREGDLLKPSTGVTNVAWTSGLSIRTIRKRKKAKTTTSHARLKLTTLSMTETSEDCLTGGRSIG